MTIYDIAKLANVSASTVSRVVNNKGYVKKSTSDRILKIMAENNYIPNETARSLVTQSSKIIGILITDIRTTHHTNGIYYIERELSEKGYSCLICNTGQDAQGWARYVQSLSQRKVDAAILMGSVYQAEPMKEALRQFLPDTPVILCNGQMDAPNVYSLIVDEEEGVYECVKLLAEKGKLHPAFLENQFTPSSRLKQKGYEAGVAAFCGDAQPIVCHTGSSADEVYDSTCDLLREHPEVDGIIYSEDALALIGFRALADLGRRVPEDISVIGINNSQYADISIPTLTSLDNVLYDLSMNAVYKILSLLSGQEVSKKTIISTKIIERQST